MRKPTRPREVGRGERVLPGVWRLRLPLPWPGVPHCNAWAVAAGDGIVLVRHRHARAGLARAPRARAGAGRPARSSTCGCSSARTRTPTTAARRRRSSSARGCELWMHPNHEHMTALAEDPEAVLARRLEIARQSGVPEEPLRALRPSARGYGRGIAGPLEPDRELLAGRRGRDRPRRLARARDARPRALARLPVPARAAAADLRRPPARPRLAVLRLRLHARPGRRVPRARSTRVDALDARLRAARPRAAVHRRRTATSRPTARSSRERLDARAAPRSPARPGDRVRARCRTSTGTRSRPRTPRGCSPRRSAT